MRFFLLAMCFLVVAAGCGEHVPLGGKVVYSDDGSPLTVGEVCLEADNFTARGKLEADGTYTIGSFADADGLPPGTYQVSVMGATRFVGFDAQGAPIEEPLIDRKYFRGSTSGIVVEATSEKKRFDFKVDRYVPDAK